MAFGLPTSPPSLGTDQLGNVLPNSVTSIFNKGKTSNAGATTLPWSNLADLPRFFFPVTIVGQRWDALFPYRFVVIDTANGNQIVNGSPTDSNLTITQSASNGTFTIGFEAPSQQWIFQLPITPEQLSISDTFAITTSATLRGIIEEHNGVKFKSISASGTFGVWPSRPSITQPPGTPSIVQSLFGGTIEAANNLLGGVNRLVNTVTSGHPASKPVTIQPEQSSSGLSSTGYYQALFLQQFLEQYAEAKKRPENAGWRLVFDIPKQNQSFIVTPMQFTWQQSVNKPVQIYYSLNLKAWRRVDLLQKVSSVPVTVPTVSPGLLQQFMNALAAARNLVSQSLALISAVKSDIEAPLEALRQTTLLIKGIAGVAVTAIDLPSQIIKDYRSSITASLNNVSNVNALPSQVTSNQVQSAAFASIKAASAQQEGLSTGAVTGGQLGAPAAYAQSINPTNAIFANPPAYYALLDTVQVANLTLSPAQQATVDNIVVAASQITVSQLKTFRQTILTLALQLSNSFGTGSPFYNTVFGLPPPASLVTPISLDQYELLDVLYDVMQNYDNLTATNQIDAQNMQNNMQYVAGLADQAGISFSIPNSMILAPVPFGLTIEAIAARYLGDPQRWIEIATLNNLQDPYIDESGFQ